MSCFLYSQNFDGNVYYSVDRICSCPSCPDGAPSEWVITVSGITDGVIADTYTQNFDTLANTGGLVTWTNDSTIPSWYAFLQSPFVAPATYRVDDGTNSGGGVKSYGTGTSTDRSLGVLSSFTTGTTRIGYRYVFAAAFDINTINVTYTGEQWRSANTSPQSLVFEWSTDATSLFTGTWNSVLSLEFISPNLTNSGAIDGNLPENSEQLSGTIYAFLTVGDDIWFRWSKSDSTGTDHGLGIDDLTITFSQNCLNCSDYNGTFILGYVSGCTWETLETSTCPISSDPRYELEISSTTMTLYAHGSGNIAVWTVSPVNCSGTNVLTISSSLSECASYPATVTVQPNGTLDPNSVCTVACSSTTADALPIILKATTDSTVNCTCAATIDINLVYNPVTKKWEGSGPFGTCGNTLDLEFYNGFTIDSAVYYAAGARAIDIEVADFDNDGILDLATVNETPGNVSIFIGNGNGTFKAQVTYGVGSSPQKLAIGDFDSDGNMDIVAVNLLSTYISILLGNGNGTFQPQVTYATPVLGSYGVVVADVDGDNIQDIVITNATGNSISVFIGNGNGTFKPAVTYAAGTGPRSLIAADVNGDNKIDIVTGNFSGNNLSVIIGNGNGTFQPSVNYATGNGPLDVDARDLNNDGKIDLVSCNFSSNTIGILLGNGDGTFQSQFTYSVGTFPARLITVDFNGDQIYDIAVVNFLNNNVGVLLGNGNGTFQSQITYSETSQPVSIISGDFNADGYEDLAIANLDSNNIGILLSNGVGCTKFRLAYEFLGESPCGGYQVSFKSPTPLSSDGFLGTFGLTANDFDGDGKLDIASVNIFGNFVSVHLGNGNGSFKPQVTYAVGSTPRSVTTGDFNGDGKIDIVSISQSGSIGVLLGNGNGTFQPQITTSIGLSTPIGSSCIEAIDVDGDNILDIVFTETFGSGAVNVMIGNGNGTFQPKISYAISSGGDSRGVAVGDVNGDNKIDIVTANTGSSSVSVLLGNGNGTFQPETTWAVGSAPFSVSLGDFTGDGKISIVACNYTSSTVSVLLGNGNGTFQPQVTYAVGTNPTRAIVVDLNNDGILDIAVSNNGSNVGVLLGNGNGTFQSQITYSTSPFSGNQRSITSGDFDNDGVIDLAVTSQDAARVVVLLANTPPCGPNCTPPGVLTPLSCSCDPFQVQFNPISSGDQICGCESTDPEIYITVSY